jgi:EAL domain-containing protein (putative c-di-GMP-specific phosphodiesterase class I)
MNPKGTFENADDGGLRRDRRKRVTARRASEDEVIALHYQPQISLRDGRLTGFEATARAIPSGKELLNEACRRMAAWQRDLPSEPPLEISVNTSLEYLADPSFIPDVGDILDETGLVPASLLLEMNESSVIAYGESASVTLHRLRALGVGLEIGSFGTGNASPGYLRRLPFDALRIDRSFVKQLGTINDSSGIIDTILTFAGSLGMKVDAEGVETKDQAEKLVALGCCRAQGPYISGPVAEANARAWIRGEPRGDVLEKSNVRAFPASAARVGWYTREDSNL